MRLRLFFVALIALFFAGCNAIVAVDVAVVDDGSGTVTITTEFDAAAVEAVPELADGLRLNDLAAADWEIEGPIQTGEGGVRVVAVKPFETLEQLPDVLDEIAGPSAGVFSDFEIVRERTFARTTYSLSGRIDPTINLNQLSDAELQGLLGAPLGRPLAEIEAVAGKSLNETMQMMFSVTLPDTVESSTGSSSGNTATWLLGPNDPLPTDISVMSSVEDRTPRIWAAVSLVALALLLTLLIFRVLARFGNRQAEARGSRDSVQMRRPERTPDGAADAEGRSQARPPRLELVVLDARGVLYDEANDIGARLVPFVRERGSKASLQTINDVTRAATLGRFSTAEVWSELGVEGDPADLDHEYTEIFRLREGVLDFIDRLHERGLRVAVITNNVVGWSKGIRARFDLDARVDTWVVSGEVGARKPDQAFFEALKRMTGVQFADSLLIDDQIDDLDMARSLGMSTAMFVPPDAQLPSASPHPIVNGFDSFFGRRA